MNLWAERVGNCIGERSVPTTTITPGNSDGFPLDPKKTVRPVKKQMTSPIKVEILANYGSNGTKYHHNSTPGDCGFSHGNGATHNCQCFSGSKNSLKVLEQNHVVCTARLLELIPFVGFQNQQRGLCAPMQETKMCNLTLPESRCWIGCVGFSFVVISRINQIIMSFPG
jgi:hypothetical protein